MKAIYRYRVKDKEVEREYTYIPFRYILAILITVLEVAAIIGILVILCRYVPYFYVLCWITEVGCVIKIIASDDNPDYKIPWLLVVMIVPIAGFMCYFLFYSRKLKRKYIRRLKALKDNAYRKDDSSLLHAMHRENPAAASQARMLCSIAEAHLFTDTRQTYFPLGEELYPRLLEDLGKAEKFIYMEYFIIEEGKFWNSILGILKEKAAQGVEVKLVYDDVGCMMTLPGDYWKTLKAFGIEATPFSRLRGNADSEFNNRSHRKITVIAMALLGHPSLLVQDEPINGLDADGMRIMREILTDITRDRQCTVLISSHILGELEKIATHYGIVRGGQMLREMTAAELDADCRTYVALQTRDMNRARALLARRYSRVEEDESGYLRVYDAERPEDVVTCLYQQGILVSELQTAKIGLEEYYMDLMKEGR